MKRNNLLIVFIITIVILLAMVFSTIEKKNAGFLSNSVGVIITPIQRVFAGTGNAIAEGFSYFGNVKKLKSDKAQLMSTVTNLERENRELEGLKNENERLRALLQMQEQVKDYKTVGASVIASDPGNWFISFIIDKGTSSGIQKNSVVLNGDGLVGYVEEIGLTWARVTTIIDAGNSCGAVVKRTDDRGITEGDLEYGDQGLCKMTYISTDAHIVPGDYIETSGQGTIFPAGILIGRIREISTDGISQTAVVDPAADFSNISEVLVIVNKDRE